MVSGGDALGVYQLDEVVGRGPTGVVFRARDTRLGRPVALRVVDHGLAGDHLVRTRLNRESTVLAQLDHPNVVPLYEAAEIDGQLCLSSRWVDGLTLKSLVRREGPLDARRAVRLIGQLAAALQAAHDLEVVHRDVKPSNVLVTSGDHVYLTDFCLARRATDTAGLTAPNELVTAVDYVAPEVISGAAVDHRVDIYGLGLVLFEALTGEVPFPRKVDTAKVYAHLSVAPPSIHERRPEVPRELDDVVQRALSKAPGDRQQSASVFAREAFDAVDLTRPGLADPAAGVQAQGPPRDEPLAQPSDESPPTPPAEPPRRPPGKHPPTPPAVPPRKQPFAAPPSDGGAPVRTRRRLRAPVRRRGATQDAPIRRHRASSGRALRWTVVGLLLLAFLAGPALLVIALRDADAGSQTHAVGGSARGLAVADGRVWVAVAGGQSLQTVPFGNPGRRARVALTDGRIRGVAGGGNRLLVATDRALIDIPSADPSRARRVSVSERLGALAVGGGATWAATADRPQLLRYRDGRLVRAPLSAPASALAAAADMVWVADARAGTVFGVDARTLVSRTHKIAVGSRPIALTATRDAVWVVLAGDRSVVRLDPRTGRPNLAPVPIQGHPVAVAADSRQVWVARRAADGTTRLDARTGRPTDELASARSPVAIALTNDAAWVVGQAGELTRIAR